MRTFILPEGTSCGQSVEISGKDHHYLVHVLRLAEGDRLGSQTLHGCLARDWDLVTMLVGPEGGLAEEEVDLARACGFIPITIGSRVWRTQTAALFAVATVQAILEEREAWRAE